MRYFILYFCIFFILIVSQVQAIQQKDMEKLTSLIEKTDNFYNKNPKLKGNFVLTNGGEVSYGYFLFEAPSKLKLFFGPEDAERVEEFRYIITDGNTLWVYLPNYQVLVEQEIPEYFREVGLLGSGLKRYLAQYNTVDVTEEYQKDQKLTVVYLKNPVKNVAYKEMSFYINAEGFITMVKAKGEINKKETLVSFHRYNINKNPQFTEKDFKVKITGDIQILRNVLIKNKK